MSVTEASQLPAQRNQTRRRSGVEPRRGGSVLLVDEMDPGFTRQAQAAATAALLSVEQVALDDIDTTLAQGSPIAALFDLRRRSTAAAVLALRSRPAFAAVPVIGITSTADEVTFQEIFWWGMDDLVSGDITRGLTARLRALASNPETPAPTGGGTVVIEGRDAAFRVAIGRMFGNSGHAVRFALCPEDAIAEARASDVTLVVSQAPESPSAALTVEAARAAGIEVPWLIGARPSDEASLRRRICAIGQVEIYDAFASPETVLFRANELRSVRVIESRRSPRVVYGTAVSFRVAGADTDDVAFSYNVSASGLYLRTLAIVPRGTELWLELRPPRTDRRIRLVAEVAWSRPFGPSHAAMVPPGMGVQLIPSTRDDEVLRTGVAALNEAMGLGATTSDRSA